MVCRYYLPFYRLSFHLLNRSFQSSVVPLVYFLSCSQCSGILHFEVEEKKAKKKKKKSTKSKVDPLERSSKLDWQKSKKQSRELKPVWMKMVAALPTLCKHKENWACQQSGYKYQGCEFEASLIWATQQVPGQPELYNETWSQKTTTHT